MGNFHSKPYYDKWVRVASPEIKTFLSAENGFLKKILFKGCTILDVGCGYGRTIVAIHKIPSKIYGIDNSKRMVKNARLKLKNYKNVKIFHMNAENMKFKKQKFDFVLCLANTFGNFSSKKLKILEQMKKMLNKKGKILVHVYSEESLKYRLKDYKKADMPILKITKGGTVYSSNGLTLEQFTKKKLKKIFNKAKLKVDIRKFTPISYICIAKN